MLAFFIGSRKIQMTLVGKEKHFLLLVVLRMQLTCRQSEPMKKKQETRRNQVRTRKGLNPRTQYQGEEDGTRRNPHQLPCV
jgi:hypothetical protein